ncbi:MAG: hypothetical protein IKP66_04520, partial [Lachnospiraceae bacterium]|nr:hypothetical protein [Lachnospiraceae bacterium]
SISDIDTSLVRYEDDMSKRELMAKFGEKIGKTLSDVLEGDVSGNSNYYVIPIYDNKYTIVVDDNIPLGANEGSIVEKTNSREEIYENDRNELLKNIEMTLPGYKLKGFSRDGSDTVHYNKGDIVRKYKDGEVRAVEKVKELFANEETKTITVYAVWEPIHYYVVFDKGNDYVNVSQLKVVDNPKTFGVEYDDLVLNRSNYRYSGHEFLYWEVDRIVEGGRVSDGILTGGEEIYGYRYDRLQLNDTATYKNLSTIDGSVVVLKAIWNSVSYTIKFDVSTPSGIEIETYGNVVDSEGNVVNEVTLLNDESFMAPRTTTVLKDYEFRGWDINRGVATPTYVAGRDMIHGLGRNLNSDVVLYGIWGEETTKVITPDDPDEPKDPDEETKEPDSPYDEDEDGNEFVYYIIGSISDATGVRYEDELTDKELMAHIEEGESLRDVLGGDLLGGATYYEYPIYNNVYTIELNDNKPRGAEDSDEVIKNMSSMNIYLDDRQELFSDLSIELKGYKLAGFSRTSTGGVEYHKGDIVRRYKYDIDRINNETGNVKALYEEDGTKTIRLYCVWEPIHYYVVFEKGNNVAGTISNKIVDNPKAYGAEYRDLRF